MSGVKGDEGREGVMSRDEEFFVLIVLPGFAVGMFIIFGHYGTAAGMALAFVLHAIRDEGRE